MERSEGQDCPNCGVYNPAGRTKCWRCGEELPLPKPKKKKKTLTPQHWLYIAMALFIIISIAQLCGVPKITEGTTPAIHPSLLFSAMRVGLGF